MRRAGLVREHSIKAQAKRPADQRPGDVRARSLGLLHSADVRHARRSLGAGHLPGADGRPGSRELGGTGDYGDPIERYRTAAIFISTTAVIVGYLVIQYFDLMGPR